MKILSYLLLIVCLVSPLRADSKAELIRKVEQYFANLKTYQADILQLNPDQSVSKGKFFLKRPDHFRLEYKEPKETVLISDGRFFIEYDPKDNIPNFLSLESTPAAILMKDNIKLSGEITVQEIQNFDDTIQVTLYRSQDPDLGKITLFFNKKPLKLVHWVIHDSQGNITEVALKNIKENQQLSNNLFRAPQ